MKKKASCHPDRPYHAKNFCYSCYMKNMYKNNPKMAQKCRDATNRWRRNNPEKAHLLDRIKYLRKKFNITVQQYDKMLADQYGVCAICKKEETVKSRKTKINTLAVDHCHTSGVIRGLLCFRCNTTIAHIEKNSSLLDSIKEYLNSGALKSIQD